MLKRIGLVFIVGSTLLLSGCSPEEPHTPVAETHPVGPQAPTPMLFFTDHTDPPIIIGKGGSLWRAARSEHPERTCRDDECCERTYRDQYPFHHFVNRYSYCAKNLKEGSEVLKADGTCVMQDNPALPLAFAHFGTMWAEDSANRYLAVDRRYVMTGVHGGRDITLTVWVGSAAKANKWTIQAAGGPECALVADKDVDTVPPEFYQLDTLRREGETSGERFPLSFAACKYPGCSGD